MKKSLICFGEILWDLLPKGKEAGGAPLNVAFHANNLGLSSSIISRVGEDVLGEELLSFLLSKGISIDKVQRDKVKPTGLVGVELHPEKGPLYTIHEPAAWDEIEIDGDLISTVSEADTIVFGSLICRHKKSQSTLFTLLEKSQLKVLDVNLRPPFYSRTLLDSLLGYADIVKVNEEELKILSQEQGNPNDYKRQMGNLVENYNISSILLTRGKDGAVLLDHGKFYFQGAFPITVKDTIGSGDAFLAGYLKKTMEQCTPQESLEFASATGALVACREGGTPSLTEEEIIKFIHDQKTDSLTHN
ncbi:MAG: carbohydrate kinase [Bacteroidota bacterium]